MYRAFTVIVCMAMVAMACNDSSSGSEASNRKNGYSSAPKTKEDSLYLEVMAGHDAGMAKEGKLRKSIHDVQHLLDSVDKLSAKKVDAAYKLRLTNTKTALNNANNEMNAWMDGFKIDSAKGNPDQRIQYLQAEKEKVTLVKEHMLSSLQAADSLLKK